MAWWVRFADGAYGLQVLQLEARKPVRLQGEAHLKQNTGSVVEAGVSMLPEGIGYVCLETRSFCHYTRGVSVQGDRRFDVLQGDITWDVT